MFRLYCTWKSAAMAPHIALEEIGAPYELAFIDFSEPWPEDYLKLNPHRKVPSLVDETGEVTLPAPSVVPKKGWSSTKTHASILGYWLEVTGIWSSA